MNRERERERKRERERERERERDEAIRTWCVRKQNYFFAERQ